MRPVIYCITNEVSANFVANALLAVGASPIMSNAPEEVEDLCCVANALVLNIGTPSQAQFHTMLAAGKRMYELHKPIVLDPVGVNATHYRLGMAEQLIATCHPTIIRGNASEIIALAKHEVAGTGLDAGNPLGSNLLPLTTLANNLAKQISAIVVVSGPEDYITDGTHTASVTLGSPDMAKTTGTGCVASAIIAAYSTHQTLDITDAPSGGGLLGATIKAMTLMGQAGEDMPHFLERLCAFAL